MINVVDGDEMKILYSISSDEKSVRSEISRLLKKYKEVDVDCDGDIICFSGE